MSLQKQSGATLLELVVTIIIAALAAGFIFSGYGITVKIWNNFSHKVEVAGGAWIVFLKVEHQMAGAWNVERTTEHRWEFNPGVSDSSVMTYEDGSLLIITPSIKWQCDVDSFDFEKKDTSSNSSIWQCRFVYSQGRNKSGMSWRTICRGNYSGEDIPSVLTTMPIRTTLYWDSNNK